MKRDMELIRRIMLTIEADEPVDEILLFKRDVVMRHVQLLIDAGMLIGRDISDLDLGSIDFEVDRITWAGHEFLDAARNDSVWKTVRKHLKEKTLSVSLSILQQLLTAELKRLTGLA